MAPKVGNTAKRMLADKNRNAARAEDKKKWKKFSYQLKKLGEDSQAVLTYNTLDKSGRTKFQEAWSKDPSWDFVACFKKQTISASSSNSTKESWKSLLQLKRILGRKGAKRHALLMSKQGMVETVAGVKMYNWSTAEKKTEHIETKEMTSKFGKEGKITDFIATESGSTSRGSTPKPIADASSSSGAPQLSLGPTPTQLTSDLVKNVKKLKTDQLHELAGLVNGLLRTSKLPKKST